MHGCPACLVLTPAFTALALMMNGAEVRVGDARNTHAFVPEAASVSNGADEKLKAAQNLIERP